MSVKDDRIFEVTAQAHKDLDEAKRASSVPKKKDSHSAICDIITRHEYLPSEPQK
ncbi:hypothetical protein [Shimazuella soli]|uniref:hypothetical protein n=1 Tax=Shimazuella soli TaxID=1892854 RepID=UPI001F0FCA95|nr:hypothetical protein [Shimazuella soli]